MCDTIVEGETGFLVDSEADYIDRVVDLLKNPELAKTMGSKGREFVTRRFGFHAIAKSWEGIIHKVISNQSVIFTEEPSLNGKYPLSSSRKIISMKKYHSLYPAIDITDRIHGYFLKNTSAWI